MEEQRCLHCEQTKAEIKRRDTICGIEEGYEYRELVAEWPKHRWTDWRDSDLPMIRPEFRNLYRRTPVTALQWISCDHRTRGHVIATDPFDDMGITPGQCWDCGKTPVDEATK